ncbi:MAG: endolytic transglycosylase MltG, partial [Proteobacteria bacterium]|nr:endolytic transglycosylase MltG [Pseudomonadota bacterium]
MPMVPLVRLSRWLLPIIVVVLVVIAGRSYVERVFQGPGPLPKAETVVVPHGTTEVVGEALRQAGVVGRVFAFRVAVALTAQGGALHAGEFAFPAHGSLHAVLTILRHGRQVEHHLTIPEGLTAQQIAGIIDHAPALTGHVDPPPEGAILPNTYDYLWGTSRAALLDRAEHALTVTMDKLWPDRAPDLPLANPAQAITLASIVERETAKPSERPMVAAVYINRLRAGMKLQADPT